MTITEAPPRPVPTDPAVAPPSPRHEIGVAARVLGASAAGLLGFVGYLVFLTPLSQSAAQDVLYSQLRGPLAEGVPPYAGAAEDGDGNQVREVPPVYDDGEDALIPPGAPIAVLEIPALGVRQVVVEGTGSGDLAAGPGHRRDTVLPGQVGVSVVYGRSGAFGAPFADIGRLRPGDRINVVTFQGEFTFTVEGVRRDGDPVPDPAPIREGGSRLTLVTAEGDNPWQADRTAFVDALLQGDSQPAAGVPAVLPPAERAMATDRGAWLPLVLWLQALLVLAAAAAWARVRWGRWETHLAAFPALAAVLWQVYETAARLLPNLA